jgi:subtilisin family serine protease
LFSIAVLIFVTAVAGSAGALIPASPATEWPASPVRHLDATVGDGAAHQWRQTAAAPGHRESALDVIGAPALHAQGLTGEGIKVGILDEDFYAHQRMLGGVLPASVVAKTFHPEGINGDETGHGTAVAEILHWVAPNAGLYFANAERPLSDPETFAEAIDFLLAEGVHVISLSLARGNAGPGDGTGAINDVINRATDAGVLVVIAAGNEGETHWGGRWDDPDGNGVLNFAGTSERNTIRLVPRLLAQIELRWDEPWSGACTDFQLRVYSALTGALEAQSRQRQDCSSGSRPADTVTIRPESRNPYYITVERVSGDGSPKLDLFVRSILGPISMRHNTTAGSIGIPGDNLRALTVGAVPLDSINTIEPYSSRGPTADGRTKPDLVAPDGLRTVTGEILDTAIDLEFYGTSASTPLVAGAAALLKQRHPDWGPAEIKSALIAATIDLGEPGPDNDYGAGRMDLRPFAAP